MDKNFNSFPQYKTLVDEYFSSDVAWNRDAFTTHTIAGRTWFKTGQRPATTYFAKIYKVNIPDKFDTSRQYMLCLGMARQSTRELQVNKKEGVEIAAEHAMTEPIAVMYFEKKPMRKDFLHLVNVFRDLQNQHRLVMTRDELQQEKDLDAAYKAFVNDLNETDENNDFNGSGNITISKAPYEMKILAKNEAKNEPKNEGIKDVTAKSSKKEEKSDDEKRKEYAQKLADDISKVISSFSSILGIDTDKDVDDEPELSEEDIKKITLLSKLLGI